MKHLQKINTVELFIVPSMDWSQYDKICGSNCTFYNRYYVY